MMQRLTWIAASSGLLALSAFSQQRLDPSRMFPITSPIRDAGTVDVTTGTWTRPGAQLKVTSNDLYNNTCSWQTQAYYAGFDWCEDNYDEGRVPSPSDPNAPVAAQSAYSILSVEVSYCTFAGPLGAAGYDMDVAFWDKLGGDCVGTVPPTPPPASTTATAYFPLAGLGLPGSTAFGFQACWLVTLDTSNSGFVLAGDGDGTFDGVGADDKFVWMQRQNTTTMVITLPMPPDGFFVSGEPATGGFGACSFSIPCGIDAVTGDTCGTGLDTFDASWINVDGVGVGSSAHNTACANAISQYGYGSNCYFFGGYPSNPFASYWLVLGGNGPDGGILYCFQSKSTSVAGCTAVFSAADLSLATGVWSTTNIPRDASLGTGAVVGLYLYTNGVGIGQSTFSANIAFGTLCLNGTSRSGPAVLPGALAGVCNAGTMNVAVSSLTAPAVAVGEDVNAQFWYRDPLPGNAGNANLSNAIFYTLQ